MDTTTDTSLREGEAAATESRCTCCQPASATRTTEHAGALAARRAAVGRRLKALFGRSVERS